MAKTAAMETDAIVPSPRSRNVLAWAMSKMRVENKNVFKREDGRTARPCSTYESRQRQSVERGVRAAAASEVRVRVADGLLLHKISAAN